MICNCDGCCKGHAGQGALTGIARLEGERGGGMYRPKKSQEIDDQTRPASCPAYLKRKEVAVMVCNCDGGCKGHAGPAAPNGDCSATSCCQLSDAAFVLNRPASLQSQLSRAGRAL